MAGGPDDEPLQTVIQQRPKILQAQHVPFPPLPVRLRPTGRDQHVAVDLAAVHD
jgi:hypothetical protein